MEFSPLSLIRLFHIFPKSATLKNTIFYTPKSTNFVRALKYIVSVEYNEFVVFRIVSKNV